MNMSVGPAPVEAPPLPLAAACRLPDVIRRGDHCTLLYPSAAVHEAKTISSARRCIPAFGVESPPS